MNVLTLMWQFWAWFMAWQLLMHNKNRRKNCSNCLQFSKCYAFTFIVFNSSAICRRKAYKFRAYRFAIALAVPVAATKISIMLLFIQAYAYEMLETSIWRHVNKRSNSNGVKRAALLVLFVFFLNNGFRMDFSFFK